MRLLPRQVLEDGSAQVLLGVAARQVGREAAAQAAFAKAAALDLDFEELRASALRLQDSKDYPTALAVLSLLGRRRPQDGRLLKDLGVCEYFAGRPELAERHFREAIAVEPGLLSAALSLGAIYEGAGKFKEALEVYQKALEPRPEADPDPVVRGFLLQNRDLILAKFHGAAPRT